MLQCDREASWVGRCKAGQQDPSRTQTFPREQQGASRTCQQEVGLYSKGFIRAVSGGWQVGEAVWRDRQGRK